MKTSTTWRKSAALIVIVSVTAILGFAGKAADTADELREEFHQTYPLSAHGRVSLHNVSGAVRITGWDRNEVRVDAVKRAERRERLAEAEIKVESTDDSIRIWTKYPDRDISMRSDEKNRYDNAASVDYTVSVPRGARLDSIELVSGSMEIMGVAGDVRASTVSGHFKATGLAGEAKISTVSASLEATFDHLSQTSAVTLNSVSGDIMLTLPSDAEGQVRANTLTAPITNGFGLEAQRGDYVGHELYGQLGKGGTQVRLNTVSGRISIQHAADGKTLSPATSLLSKRRTETVTARVRVRNQQSQALIKARQAVLNARAELRHIEREPNLDRQKRTIRSLTEAERNVAQSRAELQRAQSEANSEGQRAAAQALAAAERKLAEARAGIERSQAEQTAEIQRERARAFAEAQRKVAQTEVELQRVESEEISQRQAETAREVRESNAEVQRAQRQIQEEIRREMLEQTRSQQAEVRRQAREAAIASRRDSLRTITAETAAQIQRQTREATRAAVRDSLGSRLRFRDSESKSFTVGAKPRVTIGTFDGRVTLHAWDKNEVTYTATKTSFSENALKGITLNSSQKGSEVSIIANLDDAYVHRVAGVKSINAYANIEVYVPRNGSIHVSTGEGAITVQGVSGELELRNSAGSIVVIDSKGQLTVNAGNGQVRVTNFDGAIDARSGQGRIYLGGRFTQLSAQTNNQTIVLTLSPDTNAIIETDSDAVINEGVEISEESGPSQRPRRFRVGRGGPLFTLRSGAGNIILRRTDSGPM